MLKYRSNSRENQDRVILALFNSKKNGTYLEIGAADPIIYNNTYLLETEFNWSGVSIEYDPYLANKWKNRKNPCICGDATKIDYDSILEKFNIGTEIDFLQLDIDPASNTLEALKKINFKKYNFSFITFEHDFYSYGDEVRKESRKIFYNLGYTPLITDVMHNGLIFEDWYINEKTIKNDNWKKFLGDKINLNTENLTEKYLNILKELI